MTPERKFELDAITAFIDGMLKDSPGMRYAVLLHDPEIAHVDMCSTFPPNELPRLLRAAADQAHNAVFIEQTEQ